MLFLVVASQSEPSRSLPSCHTLSQFIVNCIHINEFITVYVNGEIICTKFSFFSLQRVKGRGWGVYKQNSWKNQNAYLFSACHATTMSTIKCENTNNNRRRPKKKYFAKLLQSQYQASMQSAIILRWLKWASWLVGLGWISGLGRRWWRLACWADPKKSISSHAHRHCHLTHDRRASQTVKRAARKWPPLTVHRQRKPVARACGAIGCISDSESESMGLRVRSPLEPKQSEAVVSVHLNNNRQDCSGG
jgi:hypothetical protein